MKKRLLPAMVVLTSLAWSLAASANVPSPPNCSVDPCLVICPQGDIPFHVTVRDFANVPIANSAVVIDFCSCVGHGFSFCLSLPCRVVAISDIAGRATFNIPGGGLCATPVSVYADGVLLASRTIASPDQNGDMTVDAADAAILGGKIGTTDPSGDLDCDGSVTPNDQSTRALHAQHSCGAVPTQEQSWGRTKAIYR